MELIVKTNIQKAQKKYKLSKKETKVIANTLSVSFKGYPLFEYFSNDKYSIKKMETFWKVNLKTISEKTVIIGDSEEMNSLVIFSPYENNKFSVWKYIKAGGLFMAMKMGAKSVKKMSAFEKIALEIKAKYAHENCWYLYTFVTKPVCRGKGIGRTVITQMLDYLDKNKQDCYLETLLPINLKIYKKYGFELQESVPIPNTDLTIYALLRKYQNK